MTGLLTVTTQYAPTSTVPAACPAQAPDVAATDPTGTVLGHATFAPGTVTTAALPGGGSSVSCAYTWSFAALPAATGYTFTATDGMPSSDPQNGTVTLAPADIEAHGGPTLRLDHTA